MIFDGELVYAEKELTIKVVNVGVGISKWINVVFDLRDSEGNKLESASSDDGKPIRESGLGPGDSFVYKYGFKEGEKPDPAKSKILLRYK